MKLFFYNNKLVASGGAIMMSLVDPNAGYTPSTYFTTNLAGTITGYDAVNGPKNVIIPPVLDGAEVTAIGYNAFALKNLTSVIIPEGVTHIYDSAFEQNMGLTVAVIPSSVVEIGGAAFRYSCLFDLVLPEGLTMIGNEAFFGGKFNQISIPDSLTNIGNSAFFSSRIQSVTIPDTVVTLGGISSSKITAITIPGNFLSRVQGGWALGEFSTSFLDLYAVEQLAGTYIYSGNWTNNYSGTWSKLTYSNESMFTCNGSTITGYDGTGGTSLIVPFKVNGVEIEHIGSSVFQGELIDSIYIVPDSILSIGDYAFEGLGLESFDIPKTLVSIGTQAFANNQLSWMYLYKRVTSLGADAFLNNPLVEVNLTAGLNLTDGSLGTNGAALKTLYDSNGKLPGSYQFYNGNWKKVTDIEHFYIDAAGLNYDIPPSVLQGELGHLVIPYYIKGVPVTKLSQMLGIASIDIHEEITEVASIQGSLLSSLIIPDNVTSMIGTISNCPALVSVKLSDGLTSLPESLFLNNQSLTSVILPATITTVPMNMCYNCTSLSQITIPNSVTAISGFAFGLCPLTSITIGPNVDILQPGTMGIYSDAFMSVYREVNEGGNGRFAGTYTYAAGVWTKNL